jgi:hypothetical protein
VTYPPAQQYPQPGGNYQPQNYPQGVSNGLSLSSMIIGIASIVGFGALIVVPIAGIVLGHMGLRRESPRGRGLAIAGLVMNYLALAGYALVWLIIAAIFIFAVSSAKHTGTAV